MFYENQIAFEFAKLSSEHLSLLGIKMNFYKSFRNTFNRNKPFFKAAMIQSTKKVSFSKEYPMSTAMSIR